MPRYGGKFGLSYKEYHDMMGTWELERRSVAKCSCGQPVRINKTGIFRTCSCDPDEPRCYKCVKIVSRCRC